MMTKITSYFIVLFLIMSYAALAQLHHTGSMSEMSKTNFEPSIYLDTLTTKTNLYGLGPYGKMRGEITIIDGIPMNSSVQAGGNMLTSQTWYTGSPFFVYAQVPSWKAYKFTETLNSLKDIQHLIENHAKKIKTPSFAFMIKGDFDFVNVHVVMPRSPEVPGYVADKKEGIFSYEHISGTLVGFYATDAHGIYTPKSSPLHIHFVSDDHTVMGHLNEISTSEILQLYFPKTLK